MAAPVGFVSKTEKGTRFFFIGLILMIIYTLLMIPILFNSQNLITDLSAAQEQGEEPENLEGLMSLIGLFCGVMIIAIISLILLLIGIIYLFSGRVEFGNEHAKNTEKGIIILIITFIIGTIITIVLGIVTINLDYGPIITSIVSIFVSIFYGLGFILVLKVLLDKKGNDILKIGVIIFIIFSIINTVGITISYMLGEDLTSLTSNSYFIRLAISSFSLIGWAIFAFSFYNAYKRIQWGAVKPVIMPYPYPSYPPGPGYPVPPPGAPPAPPPVPQMGPDGKPYACPSCGYILPYQEKECPKCGYHFGDKLINEKKENKK